MTVAFVMINVCCNQCSLRSMFAKYVRLLHMNVEFVAPDNCCVHMLCLLRPVLLLCVHDL